MSTLNDVEFCQWLTEEVGVAAIPPSPLRRPFPASAYTFISFAKQESICWPPQSACKLQLFNRPRSGRIDGLQKLLQAVDLVSGAGTSSASIPNSPPICFRPSLAEKVRARFLTTWRDLRRPRAVMPNGCRPYAPDVSCPDTLSAGSLSDAFQDRFSFCPAS